MLPKNLRDRLFEGLSVKTMRYVDAVPTAEATGLLARIYEQIHEDFFINGSLTSHSAVPELLAGVWTGGREAIIQADKLDQKTKEAMAATLSRVNDCPYCGDMLISLVHSAGDPKAARGIFTGEETNLPDTLLEQRLRWVADAATPGSKLPELAPFTEQELPEAIGTLVAMGHINRFSHIVMDGSPVPFGQSSAKFAALSIFSRELKEVVARQLVPGRALSLLPEGPLPNDMQWALGNPRIADAMGRWAQAIEQHALPWVPAAVASTVMDQLQRWQGEAMPMSRSWVDDAVRHLPDHEQHIASLCLIVALSPWQFSEALILPLVNAGTTKEQLVRMLNFAAFTGARRLGELLGSAYSGQVRH